MVAYLRRTRGDKIFAAIVVALVALFLFVILYPMLFVISASLSDTRLVYENPLLIIPKGFNLLSYGTVFENRDIWTGYRNTVLYTLAGTLLNVVMTVMAAYPLSRKDFYGRNFFTFIFIFTMFFNGGLIPTYLVVRNLGLLNKFVVMILPNAVNVYYIVIMRTFFQTRIPDEIEESAKIDGCTNIYMLIKIILPLAVPVIAVMVMFYSVGHWNSYFQALIYLTSRNRFPLQLILREILVRNQMEEMLTIATDEEYAQRLMTREGLKYAVVVVASVPILVLYPFLQKFFKEGIMIGALKG